jgi:hypothetical protein
MDWEQKYYGAGGRFTRVNAIRSAILGLVVGSLFYGALIPFPQFELTKMFTERGFVPYTIVFFTSWALVILFIKSRK